MARVSVPAGMLAGVTPLRTLLDVVLPSRCVGCDGPAGPLCGTCADGLSSPFPVRRAAVVDGPPVYALGYYAGAARRAVLAYKERGRRELAAPLGRLLGVAVARLPPVRAHGARRGVCLVPVPSRAAAARARGGQHVLRLARRCAATLRVTGLPARAHPVLALDRRARDAVGLGPADRLANVAGRLRYVADAAMPQGTPVVLLDDVITTGATAAACCAALAGAGHPVLAVIGCTATESRGLRHSSSSYTP